MCPFTKCNMKSKNGVTKDFPSLQLRGPYSAAMYDFRDLMFIGFIAFQVILYVLFNIRYCEREWLV